MQLLSRLLIPAAGPFDPAQARETGLQSGSGSNILWMDEIHFAPPKTPWKTILCWFLQENHHFSVSSVVQDFVHPQ